MKDCPPCGSTLPATTAHFFRNAKAADGLDYRCKDCRKANKRQWDSNNRQRKNGLQTARRRALTRLAKVYPEMHARLYREELAKAGIDPVWIQADKDAVW